MHRKTVVWGTQSGVFIFISTPPNVIKYFQKSKPLSTLSPSL